MGRGGAATALGPVHGARDGSPESPGPGLMDVVLVNVVVVAGMGPAPLEKEEGASPPALLPGPVGFGSGFVLGNGLLELEVDGVYGSRCLTFVLHGFFQHLLCRKKRDIMCVNAKG